MLSSVHCSLYVVYMYLCKCVDSLVCIGFASCWLFSVDCVLCLVYVCIVCMYNRIVLIVIQSNYCLVGFAYCVVYVCICTFECVVTCVLCFVSCLSFRLVSSVYGRLCSVSSKLYFVYCPLSSVSCILYVRKIVYLGICIL